MDVQQSILWRRFFSGLAYTAMQSVFFVYLQHYKGFETYQIAGAFSVLVFTSQAFSIFAGAWGDQFGRTRIMMIGCLLDVIAYSLLIFMDNSSLLLLVSTGLFGLGSTLFSTNARAFMISGGETQYAAKTKAQGKFLRISSMASMIAPLLAMPFIHWNHADWLIWCSFVIEICMFFFLLIAIPRGICCAYRFERFKFCQIKEVLTKNFILAHLLLFIPLGMASSFYVIFPYVFNNLLSDNDLIPIAFFVNNLVAVLLQTNFSRHVNLNIKKLVYIAPILLLLLLLPWFYVLENLSIITVFAYLLIFALISLFANTALANLLVCFDTGKNQGVMFGLSKLILSMTTALVMNVIPLIFLV